MMMNYFPSINHNSQRLTLNKYKKQVVYKIKAFIKLSFLFFISIYLHLFIFISFLTERRESFIVSKRLSKILSLEIFSCFLSLSALMLILCGLETFNTVYSPALSLFALSFMSQNTLVSLPLLSVTFCHFHAHFTISRPGNNQETSRQGRYEVGDQEACLKALCH